MLFRNLATIDWMIDARLTGKRLKGRVRDLLRLGLAACLYQDGVHTAVVVDACVRVAKRRFGLRMSGLVNGVLRGALRDGPPATGPGSPDYVRLNLSPELHAAWATWMSPAQMQSIADLILSPAPLVLRARPACPWPLPPDSASFLSPLDAPDWAPDARLLKCTRSQSLFTSRLFAEGAFYIQDPSTLLAPSLVQVGTAGLIGDLCAAPGGKSGVLLDQGPETLRVVAADCSRQRMGRLLLNVRDPRLRPVVADCLKPAFARSVFDCVLLDVPCSNTGVIRRRPDVRWRFTRAGLSRLSKLQADILDACASLVKPGGTIVYSTCSLEPCENSEQAESFLHRHRNWHKGEERQLFPCENHDGAYAAVLHRNR